MDGLMGAFMLGAKRAVVLAVIGIALAGCAQGPTPLQVEAMQNGQCRSWGHAAGSAGYAQCRQTLFLNEQQIEAERRAAGMQLIQNMQNRPPPPPTYEMPIRPSVNCTTTNIGNTGYTNCN
jgi:hypothetical protein